MQTKTMTIDAIDDAGVGIARIAQLSGIDSHGDSYEAGAFAWKEQWCYIVPAHDWGAMPMGKARVYEDGDWAMAELRLNLQSQQGRELHSTLKFDLATGTPVQQWSYGYDAVDALVPRIGRRVLKRIDVIEVSPVLRGAGIGTGTVAIKGAALKPEAFAALMGELATIAAADPATLSATGLKQLGDMHAAIGAQLGKVTGGCASCGGKHGDGDCPTEKAIGDYLRHLSRRHLRS